MLVDPAYFALSITVLLINVIPAFMPATWLVLSFFYIYFHLSLVPVVILGAICAVLGRLLLYNLSRTYLKHVFPQGLVKNYQDLGSFFDKHQSLTIPMVFTYAFLPIPSNQMFIIAGLANLEIKIIALSFFLGRLISYSFWVSVANHLTTRLDTAFVDHFSSQSTFAAEGFGFSVLVLIGFIPWRKVLRLSKHTS